MAESEITPPDDLRRDVRTALKTRRMDSFKEACKFLVATATVLALLGAGLIALMKFNSTWLVAFVIITIASGIVAYVIDELTRLNGHSQLLRQLVDSEKYYESLLREARKERQVAEDRARSLQTRLDVVMGVRELIKRESDQAPGSLEPTGE